MAATKNCISNGDALPATTRLPIISMLIPNAATSGSIAAQPSAAKFGRNTTSTPAKATSEAIAVSRRNGSPRNIAARKAVTIGLVKVIEAAVASGMTKMAEKNPAVAKAKPAPRSNCTLGCGILKPDGPCLTSNNAPNPIAPIANRRLATAVGAHNPAIVFTTTSPSESTAKPASA